VNVDQYNKFCATLPATSHVVQWGGSEVWKVGGKMFAVAGWNKESSTLGVTFKVSRLDFEAMVTLPGIRPAPYLASRGMSWVQHYAKPGLGDRVLREHIVESHHIVSLGLTKKLQRELGLNQTPIAEG
jgi:predicted DNA-binding protein (MmcQ/YjbR family)